MKIPDKYAPLISQIQESTWAPLIAFLGGFAWDAITLSRVDNTFDLITLTAYLLGAALLMLLGYSDKFQPKHSWLLFIKNYHQHISHFFLGGLFSAYVVFLFQSVSFSRSIIFFILIAIFFVVHEFMHLDDSNIYFKTIVLFVTGFLYLIFVLPLLLKQVGILVFFLSAIISAGCTAVLIYFLRDHSQEVRENLDIKLASGGLTGVFLVISLLYGMNWMPPVPMALKDSMMSTYVMKKGSEYQIAIEEPEWYQFWRSYAKTYSLSEHQSLFCYASIYVPGGIETQISHRWMIFDQTKNQWVKTDEIPYNVFGGRIEGYRGYTFKEKLRVGEWKIEVIDSRGAVLGVIPFEIVE